MLVYSAARPGDLPSLNPAVVADVDLPTGTIHTGDNGNAFWVSDEYLERPAALAAGLARQFPQSGLWPVGWSWESESPAAYATEHVDLGEIGALDVNAVVAKAWEDYGFDPTE